MQQPKKLRGRPGEYCFVQELTFLCSGGLITRIDVCMASAVCRICSSSVSATHSLALFSEGSVKLRKVEETSSGSIPRGRWDLQVLV